MTLIHLSAEEKSLILEIITFIIPFLLGLFASMFIDILRSYKKISRNKKFIKLYLKDVILEVLPKLESAYTLVKKKTNQYELSFFSLPAFENFNTNVLNGIKPVDYYEIFKDKYVILDEIITMIKYISEKLPAEMHKDYYEFINNHLIEEDKKGDIEHVKTCDICIIRKSGFVSTIDSRIDEINQLKQLIEQLIK